jgi:hypothetical protein
MILTLGFKIDFGIGLTSWTCLKIKNKELILWKIKWSGIICQ